MNVKYRVNILDGSRTKGKRDFPTKEEADNFVRVNNSNLKPTPDWPPIASTPYLVDLDVYPNSFNVER